MSSLNNDLNDKGLRNNRTNGFKRTHLVKILFVFVLIIISNISYVIAFYINFGHNFLNLPDNNINAFLVSTPFISLGAVIGNDLFRMTRFFHRSRVDLLFLAGKFTAFEILVTSTSAFALRAFTFPRSVFLVGSIVLFLLTLLWGIVGMYITGRLYSKSPAILIGKDKEDIEATLSKISLGLSRYGIVIAGHAYEDDTEDLLQAIFPYPEVMITSGVSEATKSRLILNASLAGKVIHLIPQYYELALYNASLLHLDDALTFLIDRVALTFEQRLVKRLFDLLFSSLVLLLLWPIMLICWIIVKVDSPGPGLFLQERVTLNGRHFNILKFRTMYSDAESVTGPVIASKQDPRITKVGRFLRRSKLDELPQFINVLKGDMSVVGPRSERPFFVSQFSRDIEGYVQRFKVKAGITGYAQISGNYDTAPEDKLRFDLIYIRNYSLLQDIKLILDTIRMIFTPTLYKRIFEDKLRELSERQAVIRQQQVEGKNHGGE